LTGIESIAIARSDYNELRVCKCLMYVCAHAW